MQDLVKEYKGDLSNYDLIKSELENVLEELEDVDRIKVTRYVTNDVLNEIKKIRLTLMAIF